MLAMIAVLAFLADVFFTYTRTQGAFGYWHLSVLQSVLGMAALVSTQALSYVAGIIRRHRAAIGSCWRELNPGLQAMLVLVHKGATLAELGAYSGRRTVRWLRPWRAIRCPDRRR